MLLNRLTNADKRGFIPFCPEFLIEPLPESDGRELLIVRMQMWLANGVELPWMIDPFAATISIFRSGTAVQVLARPDWVEASTVVPGFRLETSRLWAK